jgi:hypothetical protein
MMMMMMMIEMMKITRRNTNALDGLGAMARVFQSALAVAVFRRVPSARV